MRHIKSFVQCLLLGLVGLALTACGGGDSGGSSSSSSSSSTPAPTYTVSGTVSGLTASGLVLQLNGAGNVTVASGATSFAMTTALTSGQAYAVTISTPPTGLTCTLANASGTIGSANVSNVTITCVPSTYAVTTSITGLTASGLTLQLNANSSVAVASGATTYAFTTTLVAGQNYGVAILAQPTGLTCTVTNGTGTIASANVTNVAIACITTPTYTVTANISGLTASGLTLQLNSANNATITSGATSYTFPTALLASQAYSVSILTQPTGLTCTPGISNGAGSSTNVSVAISCAAAASTYTVGGTITGLNASGLVLALNVNGVLANTMSVASGATTFTFATPLNNAATYAVTVYVSNASQINQPTGQTCTVTSGSGTIASADKTNVVVTCVTNPNTTVSGSISGLTAAGLKLTLNGYTSTGALTQIEELTLASGASTFTFANTFTSVTNVAVRVSSQPTGLTCIIANPAGQVGNANLSIAEIKCATRTTHTLVGTYKLSTENGASVSKPLFITFYNDGSYVFASYDATLPDAEYGIYNWNQSTGAFSTPVVAVDTNGDDPSEEGIGLGSNADCCTRTVSASGSTLTLVVVEGSVTDTYTLGAVTNVSGSLTGSWLFPNVLNGHDFVVFSGNGTYMLSTTGLLTTLTSGNSVFYNGIENACYTATSSVISPTLSGCSVATGLAGVNANGNQGLILANGTINAPAAYSISGDTMTWTYSNGNTQTLTRITN